MNNQFYTSLAEAQQATQALGIKSYTEYLQRYRKDPYLPRNPAACYSTDWQSWPTFLGKEEKVFYASYTEAQQAIQALGIKSYAEYLQRYRNDPNLPRNPAAYYSTDWQSWPTFLGKEEKVFYASYTEAQQATQDLGITSSKEYEQRYQKDPRLPSSPNTFYSTDWQSWPTFLGKEKVFYTSYTEAQQATQNLGITSSTEYLQRYRNDPNLPRNPAAYYSTDWQSWPTFLGKEEKVFYASYTEAQQATQDLGITSCTEYLKRYRDDPRLPSSPAKFYSADWQSWPTFLLKKEINTLNELKIACKVLGVRNSREYRKVQKDYSKLPSKPDKKFKDWIDWYDLLDIPKPY